MKKLLAIFLTIAMLCACIPVVTAAATETPTISVSSVTARPGGTVSVDVTLSNNPGVYSVYLMLYYDTDCLELVSVSDSGLLPNFLGGETVDQYPYGLTWDGSLAEEPFYENGKLATLTFKVSDTATAGEVPISVESVGGILGADSTNIGSQFTFVQGAITIQNSFGDIKSADVALGTDIAVNYYAKISSDIAEKTKMRFTINTQEPVYVTGVPTGNADEYRFTFNGVAPQAIADTIYAELLLDDTILDTQGNYSVLIYCQKTLAKTAAQLGMSDASYAAMRTLIADLLEYGAAAQLYTGYKTDHLVNANITGKSDFVELVNSDKVVGTSLRSDVKFRSIGGNFGSTNALYVRFNAPGLDASNCYIRVYNQNKGTTTTYNFDSFILYDEATSTYQLYLDPIYASRMDDVYTIELYAPKTEGSGDVGAVQTIQYSLAAYVAANQNKIGADGALTAMAKLARATYNYGLSAKTYLNTK